MRALSLLLFVALAACNGAEPQPEPGGWKLVVLGIAQDGGMPHLGCSKPPCSEVRRGTRTAEKVSCIGLVNRDTGDAYLFDATRDLPAQVAALTDKKQPDGIFLTHGHIGHYTGLMFLGKETLGAKQVPVYGTKRMANFLRQNGPWSLLVEDFHIDLFEIKYDKPVDLGGDMKVTPIQVPHRDEFTDTVGYLIEGPRKSALFIPDIDKWEKWDRSIRDYADQVDYLFVDGTFGSGSELPGRDLSQIPHPMMTTTRKLLKGTRAELWFIHLNHSNPAIRSGGKDILREGQEFDF